MNKGLLYLFGLLISSVATADIAGNTLPYEKFAFQLINHGFSEKKSDQLIDGVLRCAAIIEVAAQDDLLPDEYTISQAESAYQVLQISTAFADSFETGDMPENQTVTDMLAMTNKYSSGKGEHISQYKRWLELIETASQYHPFQIELRRCIKTGLEMQRALER